MVRGLVLLSWVRALAGCRCESAPRTEIPRLEAPRVAGSIVLDGRLDEPLWQRAARTDRFVDTLDGRETALEASARIAWSDQALLVAFEVRDPLLIANGAGHDAHLWEEDAVELMIDPDGDGLRYAELQVSPTNLVFDTHFDSRRAPAPFGHVGWSSLLRSGVALDGQVNDEGADHGWTAEIAIPWTAFSELGAPGIPHEGSTFRMALYVLDKRTEGQLGAGWSAPLVGDFHVPERFGYLTFVAGE